jgi:hypothetical protein
MEGSVFRVREEAERVLQTPRDAVLGGSSPRHEQATKRQQDRNNPNHVSHAPFSSFGVS